MSALAGVALEHPVMNAAGTCKSVEDVDAFARSAVAAIVVGSITRQPRTGNAGNVYWPGRIYSINALGLPNRGLDYYGAHLPRMVDQAHEAGKPLIVSVAGFDVGEYAEIAEVVAGTGVDLIELNLACPNVWDGGAQKRIACFDSDQTAAVCTAVGDALLARAAGDPARRVPYGVKISPFSDPAALAELAAALAEPAGRSGRPGGPRFVTAVNTFPNALVIDADNRPVVDVELAGMSGPALKPVGLGQVRQLRRLLPDIVDVVGAGGVGEGRDVAEYLRAGAVAVQAATAFWNRGEDPSVFGSILAGWIDQMDPAAP
ncbi:dihydroorotate dehydrogenase [Candidatus Frankia alpina]|uniref:Dihydroorotate dehydrogenase n=1 Tax=Candidatus Frankia alpina TaxID=2699483 RepID=A0A4S5EEX7_9ACTN|nr:dihydroorotate dehydrogenase [Candidatus Frankia alpina]THJ70481.1 dihydroorotate dehydrogenase [Candidatus Frankia alpina]